MKSKLIFPVLFLFVTLISSCQKQTVETSKNLNQNSSNERKVVAVDINREEYNQLIAANNARLALLDNDASRGGCVQTVIVPDDYETIQDAMDAVCKNGSIIVNAGVYNENVLVNKAGLSLKAIGNVTVNGVFFLYSNADRVEIQNFTITPKGGASENSYNGIYGYGIQGGVIKQNTITGVGDRGFGIVLENSSDITIEQNQLSDFKWGIVFRSVDGIKASNKNIIQDNTVEGITFASCIGLEGDCNLNLIKGNVVQNNPNYVNAGICLTGNGTYLPDQNIIEYNTVTNNLYTGILIDGGSHNSIGPDNICTDTYGPDGIGIYLSADVTKSQVFNNEVSENYWCDIVYEYGADIKFENNQFDCFRMVHF